jgi:hypothetical protein
LRLGRTLSFDCIPKLLILGEMKKGGEISEEFVPRDIKGAENDESDEEDAVRAGGGA